MLAILFHKDVRGIPDGFYEEGFYLEYLRKEGVITSEQKDAYFNGEPIKISLVPISTATHKLFEKKILIMQTIYVLML